MIKLLVILFILNTHDLFYLLMAEVTVRTWFVREMFLNIPQNSQENAESPCNFIKKE